MPAKKSSKAAPKKAIKALGTRGSARPKKRSTKPAASKAKRTVKRAAANVHETATRARDIAETVVSAGVLLKETADFVDALAQRANTRANTRQPGRRKKT